MTEQLSLLSLQPVGAHRKKGAQTSTEAAMTCDASRQRDRLLSTLAVSRPGLTCDELETATSIPRYIVASRLSQMRRDGQVEAFGVRENAHGRNVQIWHARYTPRVVDAGTESGLL